MFLKAFESVYIFFILPSLLICIKASVDEFLFVFLSLNRKNIGTKEETNGHTFRNPNNAQYAKDCDFLFEVGGNISKSLIGCCFVLRFEIFLDITL